MNDATTFDRAAPSNMRGRILLLVGLFLPVLGVIAYAVQIYFRRLTVPWYMPVLATLGVVLVVVSLCERRSFWRLLTLIAVALVAAGEWGVLYAFRLPRYAGPVAVGKPFPEFQTSRSDGTPFSQSDLAGSKNNLLVFFRGRW